jgi:hypothetical protein
MSAIDINVTLKGHLFEKKIDETVKKALVQEVLVKVGERMDRQGKGLGAKRNRITKKQAAELELLVESTRIWPRTKGTAWTRKNIAIVKAMAPRVMRKAAQRIAEGT